MPEPECVLSKHEIVKLARAFGMASPQGRSEDEFILILKWAINARIAGCLLDQALAGEVALTVRNGEVLFNLSQIGRR